MRKGGGPTKGSKFERDIARRLSRWISNGKREDLLWRTSQSGGRATYAKMRGKDVRQVGDLCAVDKDRAAHKFVGEYFTECKHVRDLDLASFLVKDKGKLAAFWRKVSKQAREHDRRPFLVAQQNFMPTLLVTDRHVAVDMLAPLARVRDCKIWGLDDVLRRQHSSFRIRFLPAQELGRGEVDV